MKTIRQLLQCPLVMSLLLLSVGCKKNPPVTTPPAITNITPLSGSAGVTVTITGTDFGATAADNTVKFNGAAASITSATTSSLVVVAPAGGATGPVTVTTQGGTATGPVFTYVVIPPPPTITTISPVSGSAGVTVTINGTHFKTTATDNMVKFNGTAATVQTATATVLTVLAPASGTTGAVTVTTSDGTATGPVFTYVQAPADVYLVGTSIYGHSYWKNGVRTDLPAECVEVRGIFVAGTDVYVAGTDNAGNPTYWKNGVGVSLPMSSGHNGGRATSVFVSGTDVYVVGYDMNNGAYPAPRCWKNGVALNMTFSVLGVAHSVWVDGSDVYVAGSEGPATGNLIATIWKNGTPTTLTDGTYVAEATGVTVAGGAVYVSGYIEGPVQRVYWKDGVAVPLSTPGLYDCSQWGIYVSTAGDVYVSGVYQNLAKYWKNGVMNDLTTTTAGQGIYESAMSIAGSGSDVYIAGNAISLGVGYWKNGVFTALTGASQVNGIFVK